MDLEDVLKVICQNKYLGGDSLVTICLAEDVSRDIYEGTVVDVPDNIKYRGWTVEEVRRVDDETIPKGCRPFIITVW